jgi:hypothetical protein
MKIPARAAVFRILRRPWAAIALLALAWVFFLLHPGPFSAWLTFFTPAQAAAISALGSGLLLWKKPESVAGLFAVLLFWLSVSLAVNFSVGLDTFCNAKILIPIGDSAGYAFEASRVASGQPFSEWAAAHVPSHSFFSGLTFLSSRNLVLIHLASGLFAALALAFTLREVRKWAGPAAAALYAWGAMIYLAQFLGTFASEAYGLPLGLCAAGLFVTGMRTGKVWMQMAALATLSFALAARPGAMLVLPLAGIAIASFGKEWKRKGLLLALAALAAASGLAVNAVLTRILCEPATVPMSMDFWHHANGLLTGGSWNSSIATASAEEARANVLHLLHEHPGLLFSASWKALSFFFTEGVAFAFLPRFANLAAAILFWLGCGVCAWRWRDPVCRLALLAAAGILLSTPFVPPWDAGIRPYAATIPLQMLPICAALGIVPLFFRRGKAAPFFAPTGTSCAVLAGAAVLLGTVLPLVTLFTPLHLDKPSSWFWEGRMHLRVIPGSTLRIVADGAAPRSYVPTIRQSDFARPQPGFSWMFRADNEAVYSRMPPGVLMTRSDAVGMVFLVKDDFGKTLPREVERKADLLQLRGDRIAIDKALGWDMEQAKAILDSVYLPWLAGYDYYYGYHPVFGSVRFVRRAEGGRVVLHLEKYGDFESGRGLYPLFRSEETGAWRRLDMEKKTFDEAPPPEAGK